MTEKYRFMDAVQDEFGVYDQEYNAQDFTDYFKALVTTGVMKGAGNQLVVSANGSNMITKVDTGIAFILGRYYENDSFKELTHDTETLGNSRIDRIVIRMDLATEARYVKSFIKKGVPSTNPVPPTLTQTANYYEISLAQVKIVGGQTFIATNAVTNERGKDVICPWAGSNILPNFDNGSIGQPNGIAQLNANGKVINSDGTLAGPQDTGWITATIGAGWEQISAGAILKYRRIGNLCYIVGTVKRKTSNTTDYTITTLPEGFRPKRNAFIFDSSNHVTILNNGMVNSPSSVFDCAGVFPVDTGVV